MDAKAFAARWRVAGGSERANYQTFLNELCEVLGVPLPEPSQPENTRNSYVFERSVTRPGEDGGTSTNYIDLYKRGCFVLETKQGVNREQDDELALSAAGRSRAAARRKGHGVRNTPGMDTVMIRAKQQAERYARLLPPEEGRPPFLLVVDIGATIEVYAEFTRTGGVYTPFPDASSHRIPLERLVESAVQDRLRLIWTNPLELDPGRRSARVTRDIAAALAKLAQRLEAAGHQPGEVAQFLMRCLFTMFAEDIKLLPPSSFLNLLQGLRSPSRFRPMVEALWATMNTGGFSPILQEKLLRFNGGLFADPRAIDLTDDQLALLKEAASAKWAEVEPAIFGTLLERALDPVERHKLGAHYTPRAYVERLVVPTVMEPLRADWEAVQAAAVRLDGDGRRREAAAEVEAFHQRLCQVRVLDPACGSGNFLYVALELMKRLEGEVLDFLGRLQGSEQTRMQTGILTVDPHQFLGIEVNPRAAAIAELVLWIGYLQWHFRTHGEVMPPEPVIRDFRNIERRNALIDEEGGSLTEAVWPSADFVIGNPPFLGKSELRAALPDGQVERLRSVFSGTVPDSSDYVMYWWAKAARLLNSGEINRFGFITTNGISLKFNRRIVEAFLKSGRIVFCVPDHPWSASEDSAAVRIAMTACADGVGDGVRRESVTERYVPGEDALDITFREQVGRINCDLSIGVDVSRLIALSANANLTGNGVMLGARGFLVFQGDVLASMSRSIKPILSGNDLLTTPRNALVIDFYGSTPFELRTIDPEALQRVVETVKPLRDRNQRKSRRENWWLFSEVMPSTRRLIRGLKRYIGVPEVSKHRLFSFVNGCVLPEHPLVAIGLEDAYFYGVLSSSLHVAFSLRVGGVLEDRPRYNKTLCFDPFPFPDPPAALRQRIRDLGEQLDAHRKRQQALHPGLTLTGMYNVLEKLRAGDALTAKEKTIHEQGLVSVLRQIHDDLDAAVLEAYGWGDLRAMSGEAFTEELLARLVALNRERAEEEARGIVRWLRPEFQNAGAAASKQEELDIESEEADDEADVKPSRKPAKGGKPPRPTSTQSPWPTGLLAQTQAIRAVLESSRKAVTPEQVAAQFTRANRARVEEIMQTLAALGQATRTRSGAFMRG